MKTLVRKPTTGDHEENWISFNRRGWSLCGRGRYMAGLYRHSRRSSDYIYLIEKAYCVDAPGYLYSAKRDQYCYDHNWWKSFNKKGWSTCSNGYYMTGLWRNSGNKLYHIEEAKCCRPKSQVTRWGRCYNHNAWESFNRKGWTKCKPGFYMVGLYRNSCNKLYCLEEFKCCKMGAYNGNSWVERPDLVIKVKDQGQLKQCSMNAMDKSADSNTYKCSAISDRSNMLAINALKFNIEDKSPLNVAKPEPVRGFRPVICSAYSNPYKCTKSLTASVSTSSTFKVGSGFSVAVTTLASAQVGAPKIGIGGSFGFEVTKTKYFNAESTNTTTHTTTDLTDVSIEVPKNTEITINLLRTVQDLEYKWKAIFQFSGKYSAKWSNDQEIFQDVTTVLSGSKREMYAFGSWRYPDTDVLRVVITDKYGNMKSEGCEHETGKGKICDM
ncbi:uncharacterized protein LOC114523095 [Dendronephthya gigantea]|uniref:uncharacterized protein LOC114523095 n=1 Tax=Dendronephthya gigantea TaxID=151771 RepID=UPI00106C6581|nr:uncharacterized protein LOC114523095 [Dendronephthya gigantea]